MQPWYDFFFLMFNHHCFTNVSNDTSALGLHFWQLETKILTFLSGMIFQCSSSENVLMVMCIKFGAQPYRKFRYIL